MANLKSSKQGWNIINFAFRKIELSGTKLEARKSA